MTVARAAVTSGLFLNIRTPSAASTPRLILRFQLTSHFELYHMHTYKVKFFLEKIAYTYIHMRFEG